MPNHNGLLLRHFRLIGVPEDHDGCKVVVYYAECATRNAEFRPHNLRNIRCGKKLAEFSIVSSVIEVVVCYLLNKRMATLTIVPYCHCQQIAEHSAPVIPQSIRGRIPHSAKYFRPDSVHSDFGAL